MARELPEIESRIRRLKHYIDRYISLYPDLYDVILRHSVKSPSSAYNHLNMDIATVNLPSSLRIAAAKLSRWLAVVKRDYGEDEYNRIVNHLFKGGVDREAEDRGEDLTEDTIKTILEDIGVERGIYRYGYYNWIGERRIEKINSLLNLENKRLNNIFLLDLFHSMYLPYTDLDENVMENPLHQKMAEILKPIRENRDLRRYTVGDENISIYLTAEMVKALLDNISKKFQEKCNRHPTSVELLLLDGRGLDDGVNEECESTCNIKIVVKGGDEEEEFTEEEITQILDNVTEEIVEERSEELREMKEALETISKLANAVGKSGHTLSYRDKIELSKLLVKYKVYLDQVYRGIQKMSRERGARGGGTYGIHGIDYMNDYEEIRHAVETEFIYPDPELYRRILEKELLVYKYREGMDRGYKRKAVILIDKSGSMDDDGKIEIAKAVATNLLLSRDIDVEAIIFFDSRPHPPIDIKRDFKNGLEKLLSIEADGGTDIDRAVEYALKNFSGDIVVISDGIDEVKQINKMGRRIIFMIVGNDAYDSVKQISDLILQQGDYLSMSR